MTLFARVRLRSSLVCSVAASLLASLLILMGGCALTAANPEDGWISLFDGSDLEAWQGLGRSDIPAGHWVIEGDSLRKVAGTKAPNLLGNPAGYGGDLRTRERFRDFELCFDFKLSAGANSGVKYNVSQALSSAHGHPSSAIGFEYQVLDDARHPDAKMGRNGNRTLASLYDVVPASESKPFAETGEWRHGCVVADGNRITHRLDGQQVLGFDVMSEMFRDSVAASKFAEIEGFAERRSGYIVLQDHFDDVWYRNIRIRRLKASN